MEEREVWILTDPDNEEWTEKDILEDIAYFSKLWKVEVISTAETVDWGHGQERKFIVSGSPENIEGFIEAICEL